MPRCAACTGRCAHSTACAPNRVLQSPPPATRRRRQANLARTLQATGKVRAWLVSLMDYDLGYFDDEVGRVEPIENPFSPKVLPMSPE
jgi:hypothetical protein